MNVDGITYVAQWYHNVATILIFISLLSTTDTHIPHQKECISLTGETNDQFDIILYSARKHCWYAEYVLP